MIFNKKKKEQLKKQEYVEKMLKANKQEETTKIDINKFNINKSEWDLSYERFSSLSTKDLRYKLEHDLLSNYEREIIKKIINERK